MYEPPYHLTSDIVNLVADVQMPLLDKLHDKLLDKLNDKVAVDMRFVLIS